MANSIPEDEIEEFFHVPTEFWVARPDNASQKPIIAILDTKIDALQAEYIALESRIVRLEAIRVEYYKVYFW